MIRSVQSSDHDGILHIAVESGLFESDQVEVLRQMLLEPSPEDVWMVSEQARNDFRAARV